MRLPIIGTLCLSLVLAGIPSAQAVVPPVTVRASPEAFSPNADGRSDVTTVTVTLGVPAALTVEVVADDTTVVHTLAAGIPSAVGDTSLAWDGSDSTGVTAADGTYVVRASADDGFGVTVATVPVTLDTRAPKFRWRGIAPEPLRSSKPFHVRFVSADADPHLDATVVVFDDQDEVARSADVVVEVGRANLEMKPRYASGHPWFNGLYRVRTSLVDDAGNRKQSRWRAFRNHRPADSRVIHRLGGTGSRVALTFDDCSDRGAWGRILRILEERHAHASFFCLAPFVNHYRAQARRTVADGHTIGSHSTNHALETNMSYSQILRQNLVPQDAWWKVAKTTPAPYFRPPYGAYDSEVLRAVGNAGYARTIIWDVDPRDWERPGPSAIADRVLSRARAGSIVVMHTLRGTAAALDPIITRLRAKGLEPVSLQELFHATGERAPADAGPVISDPFE